ncbi:MAG: PrsW family intramembrane metalloprotease [Clostridiales bacterium]|nr:PrsW family intramembrane metalloprotease [Clostridiales bacterium]
MSYIENIYVCMIAPLLIAAIILKGEGRRVLVFSVAGMTTCLLSAYISAFAAGVVGMDAVMASYEISPVTEEAMKFAPVLIYILIFRPDKKHAILGALMTAVGFATFENACFIAANGTDKLLQLLIRGFATGAMHVVCGMIVAIGLYFLLDQIWIKIAGTFALLCLVITLHAVFNMLVIQTSVVFWIGCAIPMMILAVFLAFFREKIDIS